MNNKTIKKKGGDSATQLIRAGGMLGSLQSISVHFTDEKMEPREAQTLVQDQRGS
jgi:hypothetical protein